MKIHNIFCDNMSLFVLRFATLFVLVVYTAQAYGDDGTDTNTDLSHLLSENDGDIKIADLDESTGNRTLPRPTTPSTIFKPTPKPKPTSDPGPIETSNPPSTVLQPPQKPVVLPPLATVIPGKGDPVCGRKGRCYQWFDDELEAVLDGFKRCSASDERRAKRFCCIP